MNSPGKDRWFSEENCERAGYLQTTCAAVRSWRLPVSSNPHTQLSGSSNSDVSTSGTLGALWALGRHHFLPHLGHCNRKTLACRAVTHAFNRSTLDAEAGGSLSSRPTWSIRASFRTASKATQRNPVMKKTKKEGRKEGRKEGEMNGEEVKKKEGQERKEGF